MSSTLQNIAAGIAALTSNSSDLERSDLLQDLKPSDSVVQNLSSDELRELTGRNLETDPFAAHFVSAPLVQDPVPPPSSAPTTGAPAAAPARLDLSELLNEAQEKSKAEEEATTPTRGTSGGAGLRGGRAAPSVAAPTTTSILELTEADKKIKPEDRKLQVSEDDALKGFASDLNFTRNPTIHRLNWLKRLNVESGGRAEDTFKYLPSENKFVFKLYGQDHEIPVYKYDDPRGGFRQAEIQITEAIDNKIAQIINSNRAISKKPSSDVMVINADDDSGASLRLPNDSYVNGLGFEGLLRELRQRNGNVDPLQYLPADKVLKIKIKDGLIAELHLNDKEPHEEQIRKRFAEEVEFTARNGRARTREEALGKEVKEEEKVNREVKLNGDPSVIPVSADTDDLAKAIFDPIKFNDKKFVEKLTRLWQANEGNDPFIYRPLENRLSIKLGEIAIDIPVFKKDDPEAPPALKGKDPSLQIQQQLEQLIIQALKGEPEKIEEAAPQVDRDPSVVPAAGESSLLFNDLKFRNQDTVKILTAIRKEANDYNAVTYDPLNGYFSFKFKGKDVDLKIYEKNDPTMPLDLRGKNHEQQIEHLLRLSVINILKNGDGNINPAPHVPPSANRPQVVNNNQQQPQNMQPYTGGQPQYYAQPQYYQPYPANNRFYPQGGMPFRGQQNFQGGGNPLNQIRGQINGISQPFFNAANQIDAVGGSIRQLRAAPQVLENSLRNLFR